MSGPATEPLPSKSSKTIGTLLIVLGIVIMVVTGVACMVYGATQMKGLDPLEKANLKSTVRTVGTVPMLAGAGFVAWGVKKRKQKQSRQD